MKTESDIPELFRQFSGNSANYQELTRAAAARASQARWPLLSAVELEQGDIPAVIDRETGVAVLQTKARQSVAPEDAAPQPAAAVMVETGPNVTADVPLAVLTDVVPDATPTTGEILAQASDEGVTLTKDEILALTDIHAESPQKASLDTWQETAPDSPPEMPTPTILPGTNTIFMAPAPFSARHFAQVERALAARRAAALAEVAPAPDQAEDGFHADAHDDGNVDQHSFDPSQQAGHDATDGTLIHASVTQPEAASDAFVSPLADVSVETPAPATASASEPAAVLPMVVAADAPEALDAAPTIAAKEIVAASFPPLAPPTSAPSASFDAAPVSPEPATVGPSTASPSIVPAAEIAVPAVMPTQSAPAQAPLVIKPAAAAPATPFTAATAATPSARTPSLNPTPVNAAAAPAPVAALVKKTAPPAPSEPAAAPVRIKPEQAPAATAPQAQAIAEEASVKHAGLKPLFDRLAAPEDKGTPVTSLFSRLLQS